MPSTFTSAIRVCSPVHHEYGCKAPRNDADHADLEMVFSIDAKLLNDCGYPEIQGIETDDA